MVVVAEQANPKTAPALPAPDRPAYYVAYDGGYIEAGDPIAGEVPPPAAVVAQALHGSLTSQNYLPAKAQSAPTLLLTYHWGILNRDSFQIRNINRIQPNLAARIALVATARQARDIEDDVMEERLARIDRAFRVPAFRGMRAHELLDLAQDCRYFVIVSAYDFGALSHREAKLLWRVKLSTVSPGNSMADALPALLNGGAPYFGHNMKDTLGITAPLFPTVPAAAGIANMEEFLPPPEVAGQLDESYLHNLMQQEQIEFSGDKFSGDKKGSALPPTAAKASGESFLPPALAARINAYEQEKTTLQDSLTARIKEHTPGADMHQAIDAFNQENAGRIASLTSEREAIRDELARLAAANTDAAAGKSLAALLREFAAGVQEMEPSTSPASR
jgi:hypothetical protein